MSNADDFCGECHDNGCNTCEPGRFCEVCRADFAMGEACAHSRAIDADSARVRADGVTYVLPRDGEAYVEVLGNAALWASVDARGGIHGTIGNVQREVLDVLDERAGLDVTLPVGCRAVSEVA